jgi:hypothetical protein
MIGKEDKLTRQEVIAPHAVEHTVIVRDKAYLVTVYRTSGTVWVAAGDYLGEQLKVKARSPASAEKRWIKTVWRLSSSE